MADKQENSVHGLISRLADLPPEFSEFSAIYDREIQPALVEQEAKRKIAWEKAKKFAAGSIALGILFSLGGFLIFKTIFGLFIGIVVLVGGWLFGLGDLRKVTAQTKTLMIEPVARQFGITFNEMPSPAAEANLATCRSLGVVPSWDRKSLEDEMIGERNGIPFEFFEAHLEERRTTTDSKGRTRTQWVTVFRGQCWVFDAPKKFFGRTKVARDAGFFNALGGFGSNLQRVRLEDPVFEKAFEVYGNDQVEARFLLTPDVMQALVDLEAAFKGKNLRCTFDSQKIYVAVEGGNLFEPGSMFKSFDDPDRVGDLLEDFAAIFHLIDELGKK